MPLKIRIKPESKIIAGGAVIKNVGKHSVQLLVLSDSPVLREDLVLGYGRKDDSDSNSIYFVLQLLFLFKDKGQPMDKLVIETIRKFGTIYPHMMGTVGTIIEHLEKGETFKALRLGHKLLDGGKNEALVAPPNPKHAEKFWPTIP